MEENKKEEKYISISEELEKSKKYIDMYEKAYHFNQERFDAYAENMAFAQGNQHLLTKYKTDRPWVVNMNTPYATIAIENRTASLLVNDYEGDLMPLSPDDIDIVEPLDRVYKREWERMNVDKVIRESVDKASIIREAYCHIMVDKNKIIGGTKEKRVGALTACLIEPSCVLIDPTARNLKDANYMIVLGRISKKEAIKTYPKLEVLKNSSSDYTPNQRGEIYYDNDYSTEQENVFTVWNFYRKDDGKIKKTKLINSIIVDEQYIDIDEFPILQFRWKKAAQSCYGISLMDQLLSLQKAICSIESAITNTAISYAAPSMMVAKGSGVDPKMVAKANGAPGIVYSVNGNLDNAMRPVVPPKIQQEILNIKSDFEQKIKEISGNSNQFLGDIGTAANTRGGAEIAVDRAKIIEVNVLNNISEYVEDIVRIIVKFIIKLYPGKILNYNAGKNGEGQYVFDKIKMPKEKKLENLEYQFYVELDKKSPYSKDKQKKDLMELYQFERQYDTPIKTITVADIIKNTQLENKDEIISRFTQLTMQDAQTKAQTIEALSKTANELGIPEEMVTSASAEIISSQKDTPAVDELMKMIEKGFQQQMQQTQMAAEQGAVPVSGEQGQDQFAGLDPSAVQEAQQMIQNGQVQI